MISIDNRGFFRKSGPIYKCKLYGISPQANQTGSEIFTNYLNKYLIGKSVHVIVKGDYRTCSCGNCVTDYCELTMEDNININYQIISQGIANEDLNSADYNHEYHEAAENARKSGIGIWSER